MFSEKNLKITKYLSVFLKNIEDINIQKGLDDLQIYSFQGIRHISEEVFANHQYLSTFIKNVQDYIESTSLIEEDSEIACDFFSTFLYNIFLSRNPENQFVIQSRSKTTIKEKISVFFYSQEFLEKTAKSLKFESKHQNYNKDNILIIGNCQAEELFKILSVFQAKFNFFVLSVLQELSQSFTDDFLVESLAQRYKFILTQELFDEKQFGKLITANLCRLVPEKVIILPNISFRGLHPDLVYFKNYSSPFMDYHSMIALKLHYNKITTEYNHHLCKNIKMCISSLKKDKIFMSSFLELMNRDKRWNVKIFDFISNNLIFLPLLLSINHPTTLLITEVSRRIFNYLELSDNNYSLPSSEFILTDWMNGPIWPIYNEIYRYFGLQYSTPKIFQFKGLYKYGLTIEEFINLSMDKYNEIKDEEFIAVYNELGIAENFY
ncbi:hypothetical protein IQ244_18335 [Nostoc sp. LEGE 06077]|uniref:WcbI family polysaccharide biosynthesis putative acetyltransferase n=1 Tax=Nostoc sp. LEGE 06077 TaxID=915325 RepID=UPI001882FFCB|nr:WcbI family polysaccharide biosynthesis putative acetyltransferase [Nostoc sp. LEGE 06077]MBE9208454.1 hypothetical protein [Nostoc sp. LEGE 06077]